MKRVSILVSMLVIFGILLAACAPGTNINLTGTPDSQVDSNLTITPGIPVTGDGTATLDAEMPTTETTTNANETVEPSPVGEATESVSLTSMPSTGTNTSLLSNQMQFTLVDQGNQTIGQVKDLVLDLTAQQVAYLVVNTAEGTANVPGDILIPWNLISVENSMASDSSNTTSSDSSTAATSTPTKLTPVATMKSDDSNDDSNDDLANGVFVFTGDTKMLSDAPAFKVSDLPELGIMNSDWDATLVNFWNGSAANSTPVSGTATPSMTQTPAVDDQSLTDVPMQGVILASQLIGYKVMDDNNKEIAKVSDAVVDVSTGAITYVIVKINDKLILVPLPWLGWDSKEQVVVRAGGLTVLQGAPSFDLNSLPAMNLSGWDTLLEAYWQAQALLSNTP